LWLYREKGINKKRGLPEREKRKGQECMGKMEEGVGSMHSGEAGAPGIFEILTG
jgi:hypothetical protein